MNCTARRFVDVAVASVRKQLTLAGVRPEAVDSELAYHFDPGYSFGEPAEAGEECSADQLPHCADAVASLVSLDGLGEFLVDALEHGVASPKPDRLSRLGWSPAANALLSTWSTAGGAVELGGGSGAGFQVICEDRGIATLGGGGGGGAFGWLQPRLEGHLGARPVAKNETVGGGAGGGMQLFFPANVTGKPWESDHWISWGSGGGHGCGSCKAGDAFCEESPLRITCGGKMDDNGAVDRAAGLQALKNWRVGVLKACYDAGKLAVIGGGGGGAGGARCCAAVPRLKYGFGFRAELRPASKQLGRGTALHGQDRASGCCPDLSSWNSSTVASGLGSQLAKGWARRLSVAFGGLGGQALPEEFAPLVDPFARENTGHQPPGHANRRPLLEELMRQHDKRLGVDRSELRSRAASNETCQLPAWLNMTQLTALNSRPGETSADGSGTKEPEVALKYIFKFNPLQGYLADGAGRCGGWSDWCCVCHAAQWQIACLPQVEKDAVDWFLTEDCCESKMKKDTSSPGFVADATPLRDSVVMWRPNVGWIELPRSMNLSDSYHWMGEYGDDGLCPTMAVPELWSVRPAAAPAASAVAMDLGQVDHDQSWSTRTTIASAGVVLGYTAQATLVVILLFMAWLVKGPRRPMAASCEERYIQLTEV